MTNQEARDKLELAGYDMDDFEVNGARWFIPAKIWREVTGKRFTPQLKIGTQVTLRSHTKRWERYRRGAAGVDNWGFKNHYGIGSGKSYRDKSGSSSVRVGNKYFLNPIHAQQKAEHLTKQGYHEKYYYGNKEPDGNKEPVGRYNFEQYIKISGDGIFGSKQIVLGAITEIYVYIRSWYTSRREGRYRVQWECGSEGIFTGDYLDKAYATDYDLDEELWVCEMADICKVKNCKDKLGDGPNGGFCLPRNTVTRNIKVIDYTHFMDTTVGIGIIEDDEDKNSSA